MSIEDINLHVGWALYSKSFETYRRFVMVEDIDREFFHDLLAWLYFLSLVFGAYGISELHWCIVWWEILTSVYTDIGTWYIWFLAIWFWDREIQTDYIDMIRSMMYYSYGSIWYASLVALVMIFAIYGSRVHLRRGADICARCSSAATTVDGQWRARTGPWSFILLTDSLWALWICLKF